MQDETEDAVVEATPVEAATELPPSRPEYGTADAPEQVALDAEPTDDAGEAEPTDDAAEDAGEAGADEEGDAND